MCDRSSQTTTQVSLTPITMCWMIGGMLLLWALFGAVTLFLSGMPFGYIGHTETAGQLGDMFGGANAFFAALAVSLVGISTILQTHELREQRQTTQAAQSQLTAQLEELKLAREEAALTREEHAKTADALSHQLEVSAIAAQVSSAQALAELYFEQATGGRDIRANNVKAWVHLTQAGDQSKLDKYVDSLRTSDSPNDRASFYTIHLETLQNELRLKLRGLRSAGNQNEK